jgi:hypothetical protein
VPTRKGWALARRRPLIQTVEGAGDRAIHELLGNLTALAVLSLRGPAQPLERGILTDPRLGSSSTNVIPRERTAGGAISVEVKRFEGSSPFASTFASTENPRSWEGVPEPAGRKNTWFSSRSRWPADGRVCAWCCSTVGSVLRRRDGSLAT